MVVEILPGSDGDPANQNPNPVISPEKRGEAVEKPRPRKEYEPGSIGARVVCVQMEVGHGNG